MSYIFHPITNFDTILEWKDFLHEGWWHMYAHSKGEGGGWEAFLQKVFQITGLLPEDGTIQVVCSKNDKPLGFFIVVNNCEGSGRRSALLFAVYSNGKDLGLLRVMSEFVIPWCKTNKYTDLYAQTMRINGAAKRLFQRKGKFKPVAMYYRRPIE